MSYHFTCFFVSMLEITCAKAIIPNLTKIIFVSIVHIVLFVCLKIKCINLYWSIFHISHKKINSSYKNSKYQKKKRIKNLKKDDNDKNIKLLWTFFHLNNEDLQQKPFFGAISPLFFVEIVIFCIRSKISS